MQYRYLIIASLSIFIIAVSGCTSPTPAATPSVTVVPVTATPQPTPEASPTATPVPTPTPTPTPTPVPVYTNGSPVSVSNIKIDWDTTQYEGLAKQTATMTIKNEQKDAIVLDVNVIYKVTTPTTFVDPDGTVHNQTYTATKSTFVGMMQTGDTKSLAFQVDHNKNVPAIVSITVQWRGGSAVVFEKTLNMDDHSFGTFLL